jgi:hypothetical protein
LPMLILRPMRNHRESISINKFLNEPHQQQLQQHTRQSSNILSSINYKSHSSSSKANSSSNKQ